MFGLLVLRHCIDLPKCVDPNESKDDEEINFKQFIVITYQVCYFKKIFN